EENWRAAWELYRSARELSAPEREMLLSSTDAAPDVLQEVVSLLDESEELIADAAQDRGVQPVSLGMSRYTIGERLGVGGAGEVYSAHDRQLGRIVALKFLRPERSGSFSAERLMREAKTLSGLNHPNIVTVYEVIESASGLAIVMELVEGVSLRSLCGTPLSDNRVIDLGQQTARALATAHAHGIVHGDIKPENILIRADGYVKVVDFGLARYVAADDHISAYGLTAGTLRYMSPEQVRGDPLTSASDIFSFGLVLYELLTGCHAFASKPPLEVAQAILTKEPRPPSSVKPSTPAALDSLIREMLAKDPAGRPSAEIVARRLAEAQTPRNTFRPWKWAMAVAALVAICFGVLRLRQTGKKPTFHQITTLVPENRATAAAISPNGRMAAYANVDGIFVRNIQNGRAKTLPAPADYVVDRLAWFADGRTLAASGFSTKNYFPSIWLISGNGVPPHLLRTNARQASPSPDGTHIAFVTSDLSEIWVVEADGTNPRRIVVRPGDRIGFVLWSPDGRRLMFERGHFSGQAYSISYESVSLATGKIMATGGGLGMSSASELPDGRLLFLRWDNKITLPRVSFGR
ncbi:MAG TPA: protein kinase, partial [Terriglobales bacterium]|nr:protein kinase [Terriglobales bacterium]